MLNEKEFIEEFWNKSNNSNYRQSQKEFLNSRAYKNTEYILVIKTILTIVVSIVMTTGIVYAGVITYNYLTKETNTDFSKNAEYDYTNDMVYQDGIYYRKVMDYDNYVECTKRWNNLVEMTQTDFDKYFLIITAGENYATTDLYVSNINLDDSTLYIELTKKKKDSNKINTITSTKIPIEQYRDKIVVKKVEEIPNNQETVKITELSKEYSKEKAIEDGCFVIENNKVISNNIKQLDDFIENCTKKSNMSIRISIYYDANLKIIDIEYKDGEFIVCEDNTRNDNGQIYYYTGNKIKVLENKGLGKSYLIEDNLGNRKSICIIN